MIPLVPGRCERAYSVAQNAEGTTLQKTGRTALFALHIEALGEGEQDERGDLLDEMGVVTGLKRVRSVFRKGESVTSM